MPYGIKVKRKKFRLGRKYKSAAALLAQKKRRKTRGSLLSAVALGNAQAIKALKRGNELKFQNNIIGTSRTNYCGQALSNVKLDNYGMSQSTSDWVAAGAAATTLPQVAKYCPVIQQVCYTNQAGTNIAAPTVPPAPPNEPIIVAASENARDGNDIMMSHITWKGVVCGGQASANGGIYENTRLKQKVTLLVLLDRSPVTENPQLTTNQLAPAFDPQAMACQLYPPTPDNPYQTDGSRARESIRSLPAVSAIPPGLSTPNLATKDLEALSYYSKDRVLGETGRFKILMKKTFYVTQVPASPANSNDNSQQTSTPFSVTLSGKYKFHYDESQSKLPQNQNILAVWYSDTCTVRNRAGVAPTNYADPPRLSVLARFSFKG